MTERVTTLKPTQDWVVIRADEPEAVTPGGVHLPENRSVYMQAARGTVVAVGPGKALPSGVVPTPQVQAGDRVAFTRVRHTGHSLTIQHEGEELWMIRESELLGVFEEDAK